MKILHVITRSQWGGAQKIVYELAQRQRAAGHEVAVMCGEKGRLTQLLREQGIAVKENLHLKRAMGVADVFALYRIWQEVRQGYDLVHAHSTKAGILVRLLRHQGLFPVCFTVHGFGVTPEHPLWQQFLYHHTERALANLTDALVFVSQSDRQLAERHGWLKRARTVNVIPNGISPPRETQAPQKLQQTLNLRSVFKIPKDGFVIGNLARVAWVKNPELWLKAAESYLKENPKAYFVWYGEGPELERMRQKTTAMDSGLPSHVLFAGEVEDIDAALTSMDVLFLSSRSEGMPLAVLEGMHKRRAILAPALPGLIEVLGSREHKVTGDEGAVGLIYRPEDVEQILGALRSLEDIATRERLGGLASVRVEREYLADRMADAYEEVYQQCLESGRNMNSQKLSR